MNEKELVRNLKSLFEDAKYPRLSKIYIHTNLATRKFHELWEEWWKSSAPPKLEVDMIFVFMKIQNQDVLIPAVEVKYFKDVRDFREGIQQTLSFGLFGFDSLVLWHIFPEEMNKEEAKSIVKPCKEIIDGFGLPIVYFATCITKDNKFELFAPWEWGSSIDINAYQMIGHLKDETMKKTNPLISDDEVQKRRRLLKVLLKIPI